MQEPNKFDIAKFNVVDDKQLQEIEGGILPILIAAGIVGGLGGGFAAGYALARWLG